MASSWHTGRELFSTLAMVLMLTVDPTEKPVV
jgi:hypothetical protein